MVEGSCHELFLVGGCSSHSCQEDNYAMSAAPLHSVWYKFILGIEVCRDSLRLGVEHMRLVAKIKSLVKSSI